MQTIIDFWNWYILLFSDQDNKLRVAAWGTTITTISFVTTIILIPTIKYLKRIFSKVRVKAGISHQIVTSSFGVTTNPPLLTVTVTNLTGSSIFINNPFIITSKKINGENSFVVPKSIGTFPKKLDNGEQFNQDYDSVSLNNQILSKLADNDKVGFKVTTTTNKTYKSNQFTKRHILGHMDVSEKLS